MARKMGFGIRLGTLALAPLAVLPAVPVESREPVPDKVGRAADVYARDVAGSIGYRVDLETRITSPVFNRHSVVESWTVMKDGIPVKTRILKLINDGKAASKEDVEKQEARTNAAYREGKAVHFMAPYDRRYMAAYDFKVGPDGDKASKGLTTVRFSSARRDEQHGTGTFTIDSDYRVRSVAFQPNVLPDHVDRASILIERRDVGSGIHGIKSLKMKYEGGMGPIKGGMDLELHYDGYRRFRTLEEALATGLMN